MAADGDALKMQHPQSRLNADSSQGRNAHERVVALSQVLVPDPVRAHYGSPRPDGSPRAAKTGQVGRLRAADREAPERGHRVVARPGKLGWPGTEGVEHQVAVDRSTHQLDV